MRSRGTYKTLVRVLISKIEPDKLERMEETLKNVEVRQSDPNWTCKSWVESAVEDLGRAGIIQRWSWNTIESKALWYVLKKEAEGRFLSEEDGGTYDPEGVPTYDMIQSKETRT